MDNYYMFFHLHSNDIPDVNKLNSILDDCTVEIFYPTLFSLKEHSSNLLIYLFWLLFTKGKYRIVYIKKDNIIIHYTHILPKFFKFPFMHSKDLEIGPAWTSERYRGKGIFPAVIAYTVQHLKEKGRTFYTFAHVDNISSQKAILKAGFHKWKNGYKTDNLGIYRVEKR